MKEDILADLLNFDNFQVYDVCVYYLPLTWSKLYLGKAQSKSWESTMFNRWRILPDIWSDSALFFQAVLADLSTY